MNAFWWLLAVRAVLVASCTVTGLMLAWLLGTV